MPKTKSETSPRPNGQGAGTDSGSTALPAVDITLGEVIARMAREYLKPHWKLAVGALLASMVVAGATGAGWVPPLQIAWRMVMPELSVEHPEAQGRQAGASAGER